MGGDIYLGNGRMGECVYVGEWGGVCMEMLIRGDKGKGVDKVEGMEIGIRN
jgi:hypothetical protein